MVAGRRDAMWSASWAPPGGKLDLFTHLKKQTESNESCSADGEQIPKGGGEQKAAEGCLDTKKRRELKF